MLATVRLVGAAIDKGSIYGPIRNHAASLATLAAPKDYLGQVAEIFKDAIRRWRYVNDPYGKELLTHGPDALWRLVLAGDNVGVGLGRGAGDCDCIAAAMGAELAAIGRPVRIAITAPPKAPPGRFFSHIFVQAFVPKVGWITVDPVVHPKHGFGHTPSHSRIAYFNLKGVFLGMSGNATFGSDEPQLTERSRNMNVPHERWVDYGMGADEEADSYRMAEPEDWRMYGLPNYGAYAASLGIMSGEKLGILAEVDQSIYGNNVLARTPMLELAPDDYRYVNTMRTAYDGMMALGDDGQIYEYDGLGGFFKKLFRRAKRAVKSVAKRVRGGIRKVLKKIPGGKYLVKLGEKVFKIANKFVKPLTKFVGKYAAKLAPIAALIPGYGPAIAAGLYTAGKIANIMNEYGVKITGAAGTVRKLAFPSGQKAKGFQKALKKAAELAKQSKRGSGRARARRPRR